MTWEFVLIVLYAVLFVIAAWSLAAAMEKSDIRFREEHIILEGTVVKCQRKRDSWNHWILVVSVVTKGKAHSYNVDVPTKEKDLFPAGSRVKVQYYERKTLFGNVVSVHLDEKAIYKPLPAIFRICSLCGLAAVIIVLVLVTR